MTIIKERVEMYQYSTGDLPSPSEGLSVLTGPDAIGKSFELTRDQLTDPWGRTYLYISPAADGSAFEIVATEPMASRVAPAKPGHLISKPPG